MLNQNESPGGNSYLDAEAAITEELTNASLRRSSYGAILVSDLRNEAALDGINEENRCIRDLCLELRGLRPASDFEAALHQITLAEANLHETIAAMQDQQVSYLRSGNLTAALAKGEEIVPKVELLQQLELAMAQRLQDIASNG